MCSSFLTSVSSGRGSRAGTGFATWKTTCCLEGGPRSFHRVRSRPVAAGEDGQALLERDAALDRIDRCLRDAVAGNGSQRFEITAEAAANSRAKIVAAIDRLERGGSTRGYLGGDSF